MAGKLEVHAGRGRGARRGGLVGEQNPRDSVRRAGEGQVRPASVVRMKTDALQVRDAAQRELAAAPGDDAVAVTQDGEPQAVDFRLPFRPPPVVLVVPGDVVDAEARKQLGEGADTDED